MKRPWQTRGTALLVKNGLVLTLSVSLSGVMPALSQIAYADTPTIRVPISEEDEDLAGDEPDASDSLLPQVPTLTQIAIDESDSLEEELKTLVRRARRPNRPGAAPGVPTASDLAAAESRMTTWKS